ncbi:MAG: EF-hand domain-containing protein, partial [Planctomycetaceae bacterium]|nr:EF-hand domain-containing protein [Planctomycetaceae bacterium]
MKRFRTATPLITVLLTTSLLTACSPEVCLRADEVANASAPDKNAAAHLPVSVSVKQLRAPASVPPPTMTAVNGMMIQRPEPTTPTAKWPQYQLDSQQLLLAGRITPDDARLRFILALAEMPLVVEFDVTIDGQPFAKVREERIRTLLAEVATALTSPNQETVPADNSDSTARTAESTPAVETSESATDAKPSADAEAEASADSSDNTNPNSTEATAKDQDPTEADEEIPVVAQPTLPPYSPPRSTTESLARYARAIGAEPSAEEVRWFLERWVDGPVLMMLNQNFQRFRAGQEPVFQILDRDRNGTVSPEELQFAEASFRECDLNRDDIVSFDEVSEVAHSTARIQPEVAPRGSLLNAVPDADQAQQAYQSIAQRYRHTGTPDDNRKQN